MEFWARSN